MKITFLGLTITSSWGNGHATTFRSLLKALHACGHQVVFLEKDVEWYRSHRDFKHAPYCEVLLYDSWPVGGRELARKHAADSDAVVIGSYFPDAIAATRDLLDLVDTPILFYDIDTPITLAQLRGAGRTEYLEASMIPFYSAYLSFSGGPVLRELEGRFGSSFAVPFYCSVDQDQYRRTRERREFVCDLSYLGTYASDRQPKLIDLLNTPAEALKNRKFLVAGPMYPADVTWAANVGRITHVPPKDHAAFYSSSRFTLNITRDNMVAAGYSPSVRLFEASACGAAIVSDWWIGLDSFLQPGEEVLVARNADDVAAILTGMSEQEARQLGLRARERILSAHTARHRACQFEAIMERVLGMKNVRSAPSIMEGVALQD